VRLEKVQKNLCLQLTLSLIEFRMDRALLYRWQPELLAMTTMLKS
jgi:hypothetical protein